MPGAEILARSIALDGVEAFVRGVPETSKSDFAPGARTEPVAASATTDAVLIGPAIRRLPNLARLVFQSSNRCVRSECGLDPGALACSLCIWRHGDDLRAVV